MAETSPQNSSSSDKEHNHRIGETHGLRHDIDENTPMTAVKAPNIFQRAKEEIQAIVESIHPKPNKKSKDHASSSSDAHSEKDDNETKEEIVAVSHEEKSPTTHHHKETHGRRDDIDENTPIDKVKAPNVFERAKEEFEALTGSINSKKESSDSGSSRFGWKMSIGKGLEKICSPGSHNKD